MESTYHLLYNSVIGFEQEYRFRSSIRYLMYSCAMLFPVYKMHFITRKLLIKGKSVRDHLSSSPAGEKWPPRLVERSTKHLLTRFQKTLKTLLF